MDTSFCVREVYNILLAVSNQDNKLKKKNIILANRSNKLLFGVMKYLLGNPQPGFDPKRIYGYVYTAAEPPGFREWDELMSYFREHRDTEDRLAAALRFIQLKPFADRPVWRAILSKDIVLGNEQYLTTVIRKEENSA